jgi:glycosyltransferase involved in cell wall biosynthesis
MFLTVIAIAYRRREYLERALGSLFRQTLPKDRYEVILIKDFIDPNIDEFCRVNKVKSILMDGTIGEYIQRGITESTGDVITFLEDDDEFTDNKLETILAIYEKEKFDFMKNGFTEIDAYDKERPESVQRATLLTKPLKDLFILNEKEIRPKTLHFLISRGQDFNLSCMSISRDVGHQIKDIITSISTCPDGVIFFLSLDVGHRFVFTPLKLTYYRVHESRSRSYATMKVALEKLENDGIEQSKSLLEIESYIGKTSLIPLIDEVISIKNIRVATLNPKKKNTGLKFLRGGIRLAISGNTYAIAWVSLFLLSLLHFLPVSRAVINYLKSL